MLRRGPYGVSGLGLNRASLLPSTQQHQEIHSWQHNKYIITIIIIIIISSSSMRSLPPQRPSFRYFNKWISALGVLMCVFLMFTISPVTAFITMLITFVLYKYAAAAATAAAATLTRALIPC